MESVSVDFSKPQGLPGKGCLLYDEYAPKLGYRGEGSTCTSPKTVEVLRTAGLEPVKHYIDVCRPTIANFIVD